MAVKWTKQQRQVIESRDGNLLVSAAAGSGKTAVLVERIIEMITDEKRKLDIDRILVMTFTRAAADEMRERILEAVDARLLKEPDNGHLQMQAAMIPYAQITTIDSFCLSLLREHYNRLDIDPAFRVGEEGELLLLKKDVMQEMLEDYYQEGSREFIDFVETYAQGKADYGIEDYIMQVYTFSQSNPWPDQWFGQCRMELSLTDPKEIFSAPWMDFLLEDVRLQAKELTSQLREAIEVCEEENGPAPYIPALTEDLTSLEKLAQVKNYGEMNQCLNSIVFGRLGAVRSKEIDGGKKAFASAVRDRVKKAVGKLKEGLCSASEDQAAADMEGSARAAAVLLDLAQDYACRYQQAKKEKNLVDFNDLEHYALQILYEEQEGKMVCTREADELSRQYEEILVDEYQDSNQVQEALVQGISRERFGHPNVFMVGDVKQSIYKFRLAKPELFLEKYETYPWEEGPYQKIELHQNFRSRAQVLQGINDIFFRIMTRNLGGIVYTDDTALHPGAEFEPTDKPSGENNELLLIHGEGEILRQLDDEKGDFTSREMEAKLIAARIREMTDPDKGLWIWDKKQGQYRVAALGDMVILLRSLSGWAEEFVNVLTNEGIPACAERKTGYFTAWEVETVLSFLSVIDNPMQDIPLAASLKSPIGGVSDQELARIMAEYKKRTAKGQDRGIYGACRMYLNGDNGQEKEERSDEDCKIFNKVRCFWELLQSFRQRSAYLSIYQLLCQIYEETGFYDYVSSMPSGDLRKANLDMLAEKALAYEKTSYTGLFHFVRYIENLRKYDTDFGEASLAGQDNILRIMSIHKSKGLEFPVVFLAGMGKKFNKQDAYGRILIDSELGIATDYVDLERRVRTSTLKKQALKRKMELDSMGEELRVLYVAMTRAKEKLVMVGMDRHLDKKLERFGSMNLGRGGIPFTILSTAESCLDWLLMCLADRIVSGGEEKTVDGGAALVKEYSAPDLIGREIERQAKKQISKDMLLNLDLSQDFDEMYGQHLAEALDYVYPYREDIGLHTKVSVSELKQRGQFADEEESDFLPTIPAFLMDREAGNQSVDAAARGTAYHRAFQLLDFGPLTSQEAVVRELSRLAVSGSLDKDSFDLIDSRKIWGFLSSPLGKRFSQAQREGRLYKEQQFVIGIPAREMDLCHSQELVLIQGIIDAYMEEEGELVLVDYKTDFVKRGEEKILIDRYQTQLEYYKRALEQMTGKKVKEKAIYSLALQKEILL